jgi:hypothetical protein
MLLFAFVQPTCLYLHILANCFRSCICIRKVRFGVDPIALFTIDIFLATSFSTALEVRNRSDIDIGIGIDTNTVDLNLFVTFATVTPP